MGTVGEYIQKEIDREKHKSSDRLFESYTDREIDSSMERYIER